MLFSNVDLLFKNCLTDCLPQIRIICNFVHISADQAIAINTVEVCAKITCFQQLAENFSYFHFQGCFLINT